jgi:hypothetical protein
MNDLLNTLSHCAREIIDSVSFLQCEFVKVLVIFCAFVCIKEAMHLNRDDVSLLKIPMLEGRAGACGGKRSD